MARTTRYEFRGLGRTQRLGQVVTTADGIVFDDLSEFAPGRRGMPLRTRWRRDGPDAWLVTVETRRGRELWRQRMVRAGPSPAL